MILARKPEGQRPNLLIRGLSFSSATGMDGLSRGATGVVTVKPTDQAILLMVQKTGTARPGMYKTPVNYGILTTNLHWLAILLMHQQYGCLERVDFLKSSWNHLPGPPGDTVDAFFRVCVFSFFSNCPMIFCGSLKWGRKSPVLPKKNKHLFCILKLRKRWIAPGPACSKKGQRSSPHTVTDSAGKKFRLLGVSSATLNLTNPLPDLGTPGKLKPISMKDGRRGALVAPVAPPAGPDIEVVTGAPSPCQNPGISRGP